MADIIPIIQASTWQISILCLAYDNLPEEVIIQGTYTNRYMQTIHFSESMSCQFNEYRNFFCAQADFTGLFYAMHNIMITFLGGEDLNLEFINWFVNSLEVEITSLT
jgi:hypothetical protein